MGKKLIEWSDSYSMNIELFDNQHKKLVDMINELYAAFLAGDSLEKSVEIVEEMIKYTDYHFKSEEKYFDLYNYPETNTHKEIHKSFVETAFELKDGLTKGKATISFDIMNFLRQWLLEHIMKEDKKYAEFFNKNQYKII
jgi:hemerythrin